MPPTAITNTPETAAQFSSAQPTLYKSFHTAPVELNGQPHLTYATRVTADDCRPESVRLAPMMLQAEIDKHSGVRVTVIDNHVFAVAPRAGSDIPLDWRIHHDALTWTSIDVPDDISRRLRDYCDQMHLRFADCDFSIDTHGTWWFLEANPAGQWAWNHPHTPALTAAITDALVGTGNE